MVRRQDDFAARVAVGLNELSQRSPQLSALWLIPHGPVKKCERYRAKNGRGSLEFGVCSVAGTSLAFCCRSGPSCLIFPRFNPEI